MSGFICEASKAGMICPAIANWLLEANGTVGWNAVSVNETTAVLNDTVSLGFGLPSNTNSTVSSTFIESISLETRRVDVVQPAYEGMLLQNILAQYFASYALNMSDLIRPSSISPFYTMWWVQSPLSVGDTVQILTLTTIVNGTRTVELPNLGSRDAWVMNIHLERNLLAMPCVLDGSSVPLSSSSFDATFAYDRLSGQLLSADFDIQNYTALEAYHCLDRASYITTMGSTIALHASLTLREASPVVYTGVTVYDPGVETSTSASGSSNSPTTNDNSHSSSPTLVATITEPRNLASISILISILGLAGLVALRRTRKAMDRPSPDPA